MRSLLIFILILVAIWWLRRVLARPGKGADERARSGRPQVEQMVACAQCGVHVPESEGLRDDGAFFCCEEHRRLGARR